MGRCLSRNLGGLVATVGLLVTGCQPKPAAIVGVKAKAVSAPAVPTSTAGFVDYIEAATLIESSGSPLLQLGSFSKRDRRRLIEFCAPAMKLVAKSQPPGRFPYQPHGPFAPIPHGLAWRTIGRAFAFRIEASSAEKNWTLAVDDTIAATRFGFDLVGGGAMEADLGLTIIDQARVALLSQFGDIPPTELRRLRDGLKAAHARRPNLTDTIANEERQMESCIHALEEAVETRTMEDFNHQIWPGTAKTEWYRQPATLAQQRASIVALRKDKDRRLAEARSQAERTVVFREKLAKSPKLTKEIWRFYSFNFLNTLGPVISHFDVTTTRTKLWILVCELEARRRSKAPLPSSLTPFTATLTSDPYSGEPLIYKRGAGRYKLYSVGENFHDDNGPTNNSFTKPDLGIEWKSD